MQENTHSYRQFYILCGLQLKHVTEKQLFSTGPVGWLSARLLMTSIWGNHRFPVALIKSRLIKTFAIHPVLTLRLVFFPLSLLFYFDRRLSFLISSRVLLPVTEKTFKPPPIHCLQAKAV